MNNCMTQEDASKMDNEQAIQILKPLRDTMIDQHGCPISSAVFALDKAIEVLSAQSEATEEEVKEYCRKRCLSIIDSALLKKYASAQPERCSDCIAHGGDWECDHMRCRKGRLPSAQSERTEMHSCDCISRQAAITAMQKAYADTEGGTDKCAVWENVGLTNALHIMQDLPSAQSASYRQVTGKLDCISRQAAITAVNDLPNCDNGYSDTYDKACIIGVLAELPSVQPERKWTPCNNPPKHHKDVIVRGVEAIGNVTVHKVMQWDVDTWRPTDYAPSVMWKEWSEI